MERKFFCCRKVETTGIYVIINVCLFFNVSPFGLDTQLETFICLKEPTKDNYKTKLSVSFGVQKKLK